MFRHNRLTRAQLIEHNEALHRALLLAETEVSNLKQSINNMRAHIANNNQELALKASST